MEKKLRLLLLEDNPADAEYIQRTLQRAGLVFDAVIAGDEGEFLDALRENRFDAVLADNALPQYSSMEALTLIQANNPQVAFILVTGTVSEEFAVAIIKKGADDYILKSSLTRLPAAITSAIEKKRIQHEKQKAEKETQWEKEFSNAIINSLPGIFFLCDKNGKLLRWNKNVEMISGFSDDAITGMYAEDFFSSEDKKGLMAWLRKCFAEGNGALEASIATEAALKIPYYITGRTVNSGEMDCLIVIGLDISASKQSQKELQLLNSDLRRISIHLENLKEKEQARMAREVHDQLGQLVTGLKMDLSWLKNKINKNVSPSDIQTKINEMNHLLDEAATTIRRISAELRPGILDDYGLIGALDWYGAEFAKRSGLSVSFSGPDEDTVVNPATSIGLFRIYQEILTNIARHAAARQVIVSLKCLPKEICLKVIDDGKGFEIKQPVRSLGLLGMKERAYMIGGTLDITSRVGQGTTVTITVPVVGH